MAFTYDFLLPPDVAGSRPAAGVKGRVYFSTDTLALEYDNGSAWVPYASVGLSGAGYYGRNLIKNSPGQIPVDGAEPQWWDEGDGDATLTDEDTAGEAPGDIHERCFKCVTADDDKYGLQTFTLADEETLDAGVTVVSFGCWVYCATGSKASIAIYGTNLTLQESDQAGAGAWEWLTVENITLDAGDATIEVRLIVDTDTAWFTMPMLSVGPTAQPWMSRDTRFVPLAQVTQQDLNTTGDVAWSDTDCTANTDPLATLIAALHFISESDGVLGSNQRLGHSDDVMGADTIETLVRVQVFSQSVYGFGLLLCDDSQVVRYFVSETDADNDVRAVIYLTGYWMWA